MTYPRPVIETYIHMDNDERLRRANHLLQDKLFKETLQTLEKDIKDTWYNSSIKDIETREQCWLSLRLLERIRTHLTSILETGEIAKRIKEYRI